MKKVLALLTTILMIFAFSACGNEEVASDDAFVVSSADEHATVTYTEANIIEAELTVKDDNSDEEDVNSTIIIKNIGKVAIDNCGLDFAFYDADGNEVTTSYEYFDYSLDPGKTAVITTSTYLDGKDKSVIDTVELVAYEYTIDGVYVEVNIKAETVDSWEWDEGDTVDFDTANILSFDIIDKGPNKWDDYEVEVHVTNNSEVKITEVSFDVAYLTENMDYLDSGWGYSDSVIESGKYITEDTSSQNESIISQIKAFGIYQYSYDLVEADANGFNHYDIDLQRKTAIGDFYE